jgi:hypothetical protein
MSRSIPLSLAGLSLGEGAVFHGVRVVRRSLFGFQVGGGEEILDARAVAARVGARAKGLASTARPGRRAAVVGVCFRCAGDGLGRRDRGVCGVCHGLGISAVEPLDRWAEATPAQIAAAMDQAVLALRTARHPRARESLAALISTLSRLSPPPRRELTSA